LFHRLATASALALTLALPAAAQEVVVGIFGGSFAENSRACHAAAFEKANNARVRHVLGSSVDNVAKLRATKGNPDLDVAFIDLAIAVQAKNEGLLDQLNPANVRNMADLYASAVDGDRRFVGMMYGATAIAYNPKLVKTPPTSWLDLWDPQYKGKLALGDISGTSGLHFLIATARARGGSLENADPGFKAIADLKASTVMWYSQADQVVPLFERGEIAVAVWYPDRVGAAAAKGVPVASAFPKEGAIGILPTVAVPVGAKNKALAEKYIDALLSPEGQLCFAQKQYAGPVNKKVQLDAELAKHLPYGDSVEKMYFPDPDATAKLRPGWVERWQREIAR
jgi:putative spermidine/putrescine transport system substrate-binding protein